MFHFDPNQSDGEFSKLCSVTSNLVGGNTMILPRENLGGGYVLTPKMHFLNLPYSKCTNMKCGFQTTNGAPEQFVL